MKPQVNRIFDLLERVGWTFVEAYIGLGAIDWIANGINLSLAHQLYGALGAAVATTIKVLIAQRVGRSKDGALPSPLHPPADPAP